MKRRINSCEHRENNIIILGGKAMDLSKVDFDVKKVDFEQINGLRPETIIVANILDGAARKALEMAKLICDTYCFRIGEVEKEVWHNGEHVEILTRDGIWQGTFKNEGTYDLVCNPDDINFNLQAFFYAETMLEEKIVREDDTLPGSETTYGEMACVAKHFYNFVERTKEMNEKQKKGNKSGKRRTTKTVTLPQIDKEKSAETIGDTEK